MSPDREEVQGPAVGHAETGRHFTDARGSTGVQVGEGNVQIIYTYNKLTWTDRVAPPPLASVSGAVDSPYRGLAAFGEQDAAFFFGREAAASQVLDRMSRLAAGGGGLLVVSGVSGAGKSSLLGAGVLPRIRGAGLASVPGSASWPCLVLTPGRAPLDELALRMALLAGTDAAAVRQGLSTGSDGLVLTARQAALTRQAGSAAVPGSPASAVPPRLLLIIDQFEQLFTQCPEGGQRQAFVAALHAAAVPGQGEHPAAAVILGVRSDFEARCADYPELAQAVQDRYLVTAMTGRQLRMAITEPARMAGARVDQELVEVLLEETRGRDTRIPGAGVLPLLSHALDQAWRTRSGGLLTLADYERTGGIEGAVAASAQRAFGTLTPAQQAAAQRVFTRLTATSSDGTDTAERVARAELLASAGADETRDVETVLEAFAAERLLTLASGTVEVSHEVLLTAWPLLRDDWLAQTRADRAARARLRSAAAEWAVHGHDPSYLYTGSQGQATAEAAARIRADPARHPPLSRAEYDFLQASDHARRRTTRRRQALLAFLTVLAVALASVTVLAVRASIQATGASQQAIRQRDIALADKVAAEAPFADPGLARQLLAEAYHLAPTDQTEGALLNSQSIPREYDFSSPVNAVAYNPRAPLLAVGTDKGFTLMNSTTGTVVSQVPDTAGRVTSVAFSPRSDLLAIGDSSENSMGLRLWNVTDPSHPALEGTVRESALLEPGGPALQWSLLAFTPSGLLAVAYHDTVGLLDVTHPASPVMVSTLPGYAPLPGYTTASLSVVALSPDGHVLATATDDTGKNPNGTLNSTVRLWGIASPAHPVPLATMAVPAEGNSGLAFSQDGHLLADASNNSTVRVWDVTDPRRPQSRPGLEGVTTGSVDLQLAFSPAGDALAVIGGLGTSSIQVWGLTDPFNPSPTATLTGGLCANSVDSAAFSPSGGTLATGSSSGQTLCLWNVTEAGHSEPVTKISGGGGYPAVFSPDGRLMIAGLPPVLWDVSDPARPVELAPFPADQAGTGPEVAFGPGGRIVATQNPGDGTITLWGLADPHHPEPVGRLRAQPGAIAFTGSHVMADAADFGTVFRWDISDPSHPRALSSHSFPVGLSQAVLADLADPAAAGQITGLAERHGTVLAISPDGRTLAMGEATRQGLGPEIVAAWDVGQDPAAELAMLSATRPNATQAAFSPDGKTLAFADAEGGMSLWDISDITHPALITTLSEGSGFTAATFSPVGNLLATVTPDGDIELWDLSFASLIRRLCSGIATPITLSQWVKYLPGVPYARPCPAGNRAEPDSTALATATPSALPQPTVTLPASAVSPPLNLRSVNWSSTPIPGQFCSVPGTVRLQPVPWGGGEATASSTWWGQVQVQETSPVAYGNLGGEAQQVAAVHVMCTNGGGTIEGDLIDAYLIFTGAGGKLTPLGAITPQERPAGVHISYITELSISPGTIIAQEEWYRQADASCCPTGKAATVWTYADGTFLPGTPDVTP